MEMPGNYDKVFNDCVHGHVTLSPLCVSIIDTPQFQRLRNIKQLGMAYYVYPAASHNRFEHSIGVCYLAGQMVDALNKFLHGEDRIKDNEKHCLEVAGLCHDLGHGPFSHTWEKFVKQTHPEIPEEIWMHEESSVGFLDEILKIDDVKNKFDSCGLVDDDKKMIRELILGKQTQDSNPRSFLYEIINNKVNGIDVDKWDYLLRDCKQLNIGISFDCNRLLAFARVLQIDEDESRTHICYRQKEERNINAMFKSRSDLHDIAYQHRVVKVIEEMLVDALVYADQEGYEIEGMKLSEVHKDPKIFMKVTDHIFYDILCSPNKYKNACRLLNNIHCRKLYQYIGTYDRLTEEEVMKLKKDVKSIVVSPIHVSRSIPGKVYVYDKKEPRPHSLTVGSEISSQDKDIVVHIFARQEIEGDELHDVKEDINKILKR